MQCVQLSSTGGMMPRAKNVPTIQLLRPPPLLTLVYLARPCLLVRCGSFVATRGCLCLSGVGPCTLVRAAGGDYLVRLPLVQTATHTDEPRTIPILFLLL